jgi:hypothetical protein
MSSALRAANWYNPFVWIMTTTVGPRILPQASTVHAARRDADIVAALTIRPEKMHDQCGCKGFGMNPAAATPLVKFLPPCRW